MEGRDRLSLGGGGGNMQGSLGSHLQQRSVPSVSAGGQLYPPPPLRPMTTSASMASSPTSDVAGSAHNLMNMNIGQAGNYSGGIGSTSLPNVARPDPQKRKRGRPRKYVYTGADGGAGPLGTAAALSPVAPAKGDPTSNSPSSEKRGRGRPPGSGKKQQHAASTSTNSTAGSSFVPHVINVAAGEDVANKILAFCQQDHRASLCVLILSANGSISSVTLRHDSFYGGNITYEGRYDILSLSGSFLPTSAIGARSSSTSGGFSVSLASSDGKVMGGSVAGVLVAASPVQIVLGSFVLPDTSKKSPLPTSPLGAGDGKSMASLMTTSIGLSPPTGTSGDIDATIPLP